MIVSIDRFRDGRGGRECPLMPRPTATPPERARSRSGNRPVAWVGEAAIAVDEVSASNGTQP
jgi:hypothetical protein